MLCFFVSSLSDFKETDCPDMYNYRVMFLPYCPLSAPVYSTQTSRAHCRAEAILSGLGRKSTVLSISTCTARTEACIVYY